MKFGYSVEKVVDDGFLRENDLASYIFSLNPVKLHCKVFWSLDGDTVAIFSTDPKMKDDLFRFYFQGLHELTQHLINLDYLPKDAELVYFENLTKEDLKNPF